MALLGRRRGSSAMVDSPRNTANLLPTTSRMELHPPAGDADPWLHRDYLSPRPHRPVSTGSLETEPSQQLGALASQLQDTVVRPHPTSFLVYLRYKDLHQDLAAGQKLQEKLPPRPRSKGFTRQMIEAEATSARQLRFRTDKAHKNSSCIQVGI